MSLEKIDKDNVPTHVAIIMDGNGRWATQRNLDRSYGHQEGINSVKNIIEAASKIDVKYITLYTFSTENWNRPAEEIDALMSMMVQAIARETADLIKNNIRLKTIGDLTRLPKTTYEALTQCINDTSSCTAATLILALSYSSKWELVDTIKKIAVKFRDNPEKIDESVIDSNLCTAGTPNPDLLIRTGGEKRISNFLLWQLAYTELYFTDVLWPDFRESNFLEAIIDYQNRERRFGKTSAQLKS